MDTLRLAIRLFVVLPFAIVMYYLTVCFRFAYGFSHTRIIFRPYTWVLHGATSSITINSVLDAQNCWIRKIRPKFIVLWTFRRDSAPAIPPCLIVNVCYDVTGFVNELPSSHVFDSSHATRFWAKLYIPVVEFWRRATVRGRNVMRPFTLDVDCDAVALRYISPWLYTLCSCKILFHEPLTIAVAHMA